MIQITPQMRILLAVEPVDFRRGIDGLACLCREALKADPFSGTAFVFRNRRGAALRVLVYNGQGMWLCHKRLSKGRFRWWPAAGGGAARTLDAHELPLLVWDGKPERAGAAPRWRNPNPLLERRKPAPLPFLVWTAVEGPLREIRPLEIKQVRRSGEEGLFGSFLEAYHYLGYTQPVGEHLKYMIYAKGTPVACMAWSSAPRHIGCRDRHIGWSQALRRRNIHFLAYNTRYLILPWVKVPSLASHILSVVARRISRDWEALYCHPIHFLETFVDPERFRGTCYRAANWIHLGMTTGRGKNDQTYKPNRSLKEVLGYPLSRDFREKLCAP